MKKNHLMKYILCLLALLAPMAMPSQAHAASCSFVSIAGVVFGSYNVFDTVSLDVTGTLTYSCTGLDANDAIVIELSAGSSGLGINRSMSQGNEKLFYNIYLDPGHSAVWGNGTSGTTTYGPIMPPNNTNQTVTMFGRIPARQNVSMGDYADTIVATILF
jgi:spore coat protein U-like protein